MILWERETARDFEISLFKGESWRQDDAPGLSLVVTQNSLGCFAHVGSSYTCTFDFLLFLIIYSFCSLSRNSFSSFSLASITAHSSFDKWIASWYLLWRAITLSCASWDFIMACLALLIASWECWSVIRLFLYTCSTIYCFSNLVNTPRFDLSIIAEMVCYEAKFACG